MITIKEISSKSDMKKFVKFQMELYRDNKYYVPPIINEELEVLNPEKNPVFKNAQAWYYLAYKDEKIVGRIAVIINHIEIEEQNIRKCRFGWLDMIDDIEVTEKLLNQAFKKAKELDLNLVQGPMGFSNMEKAGMLIEGYDQLGTMITWYNFPYYKQHLEKLGFEKASEWVEFKLTLKELPEKVLKFADIVSQRYKLRSVSFTKKSEIVPLVDEMFDLLDKTYSSLETYVPIQQWQIEHYKNKYLPFIDPSFIKVVMDENNQMVAFAITMPALAQALQKINGKLWPFGFLHILRAQKKAKKAAFYLIGVHPEYQSKGVTAVIFKDMYEMFTKKNIHDLETNPELENNKAVQQLWKPYNPVMHKRRRTYVKEV